MNHYCKNRKMVESGARGFYLFKSFLTICYVDLLMLTWKMLRSAPCKVKNAYGT